MTPSQKIAAAAEEYAGVDPQIDKRADWNRHSWDEHDAYLAGANFGVGLALESAEVIGLAEAVQAFISKTQEVSKLTGENEMKAPDEYVTMLRCLVEFDKLKGEM